MRNSTKTPDIVLGVLVVLTVVFGILLVLSDLKHTESRPILDHTLAIIAILAGVFAVIYEWKLHRGFEAQKREINDIVLSVHTRHIGDWPDHLRAITDVVSRSTTGDELIVLVDHLGYGHYSRPKDYENYLIKLEEARRNNVKIRMLTYAEAPAKERLDQQFGGKFDPQSSEFKAYADSYHRLIDKTPTTYAEFLSLALYIEGALISRITEVRTTEDAIKVSTIKNPGDEEAFFWMLRRGDTPQEMLFAYPKFGSGKTGHGFITREPHLMSIFAKQFDEKWGNSTPIRSGQDLFPTAYQEYKTAVAAGV